MGPQHTDGGVVPTMPPPSCVIALRVDDCCTTPVAATSAEVAADRCLVEYPLAAPHRVLSSIPAECSARWRPQCALIDCAFSTPPSRVVRRDGASCRFDHECQQGADCVPAGNRTQCCSCPTAFPRAVVEREACLYPVPTQGEPPPASCAQADDCDDVFCGPCPPLDEPACMSHGPGELRRCVDQR